MRRRRLVAIARWAWPLLATAGTIYALWRLFVRHDFTSTEDAWIATSIGVSYVIATLFLVVSVRRWTMRSIGQVVTYLADAGLYLSIGLPGLGIWHSLTEDERSLLRAGFVIGCSCLVLGLFWHSLHPRLRRPWRFVRARFRRRRSPTITPKRRAGDWGIR